MTRKARAAALAALLCIAAEAKTPSAPSSAATAAAVAPSSSRSRRENRRRGSPGYSSRFCSGPARRRRTSSSSSSSLRSSSPAFLSSPSSLSSCASARRAFDYSTTFSPRGSRAFLDDAHGAHPENAGAAEAHPSCSIARPRNDFGEGSPNIPSATAPTAHRQQPPRLRLPTRRNFKLYDREDDGEGKDAPLPAWVESLLNWKLQPSLPNLMHMPPPTVEEEKEALQRQAESRSDSDTSASSSEASKSRARTYPDDFNFPQDRAGGALSGSGAQVPAPLASLINVEALLLASGGDILDDASDLTPFSGTVVTSGVSDSLNATIHDVAGGSATAASPLTGPLRPLTVLPNLEELGDFDRLVRTLRSSIDPFVEEQALLSSESDAGATAGIGPGVPTPETVLRSTTARIASFLDETSRTLNSAAVQDLVVRASNALAIEQSATGIRAAADEVVRAAEKLARERGVDVTAAANSARETTRYTEELLRVANGVLVSGYVQGDGRGAAGVVRTTAEAEEERRRRALDEDMFGAAAPTDSTGIASSSVVSPTDALYSKPLFDDFPTAKAVSSKPLSSERRCTIVKAAEMARLAGAIYKDAVDDSRAAGHSMVKSGATGDVAWMLTDSLGYEEDFSDKVNGNEAYGGGNKAAAASRTPIMIRTITIRGFDASDEDVDRERLLNRICTASPVPIGGSKSASSNVLVHAGLLSVARKLYNEIAEYIDNTSPNHKIVLNGHSIGGSLSVLMLILMAEKRGSDFVKDKVLRVFTFGSPPVAVHVGEDDNEFSRSDDEDTDNAAISCSVLASFSLPVDLVYGYVQPWDPIIRLFSSVDPLYPLVEDVGEDGVTLYASGPNRALRPITRSIIESWDGWSQFRDNILDHPPSPSFESVGVQHIMLPEPTRYLTDRLVGANLAVPPIDTVVRISSKELLPALVRTYPLDVFGISFVPAALRSFVHHFYPAYVDSFVEFAEGDKGKGRGDNGTKGEKKPSKKPESKADDRDDDEIPPATSGGIMEKMAADQRLQTNIAGRGGGGSDSVADRMVRKRRGIVDWASASAQWVLGGNKVFGDSADEEKL